MYSPLTNSRAWTTLGAGSSSRGEDRHRQAPVQHGRVLDGVGEDHRTELEEFLLAEVAVEVEAETGLGRAPAPEAAGLDPDCRDLDVPPPEVGRVVGVQRVVGLQRLPVVGLHRDLEVVQGGPAVERAGGIVVRRQRHGGRRERGGGRRRRARLRALGHGEGGRGAKVEDGEAGGEPYGSDSASPDAWRTRCEAGHGGCPLTCE